MLLRIPPKRGDDWSPPTPPRAAPAAPHSLAMMHFSSCVVPRGGRTLGGDGGIGLGASVPLYRPPPVNADLYKPSTCSINTQLCPASLPAGHGAWGWQCHSSHGTLRPRAGTSPADNLPRGREARAEPKGTWVPQCCLLWVRARTHACPPLSRAFSSLRGRARLGIA